MPVKADLSEKDQVYLGLITTPENTHLYRTFP
jgi:hypothetical protein